MNDQIQVSLANLPLFGAAFTALIASWLMYYRARSALVEGMADAVVMLNDRGQILNLNAMARRALGFHDQAGGRLMVEIFPAWADVIVRYRQEGLADQEVVIGTGEQTRSYDLRISPLVSWWGERAGMLVVLHDITQRKQMEAELRAQRELFAGLVAVAQATAGHATLHTTLRNILDVATRLTGASRGSMFLFDEDGAVVQSILVREHVRPDEERALIGKVLSEGLAGWVIHNRQVALVEDTRHDPRWLTMPDQPYTAGSALAVPIIDKTYMLGLITLIHPAPHHFRRDHAQLMKAAAGQIALAVRNVQMYESQRQLAEEAQAASRAKSSFIANMSHELRTPLNTIIGFGDVLAADAAARGAADLAADLGQITSAGRRLLVLVDDVLDLSQIDAGQIQLQLEPVDLTALAVHVATAARPLAAQNGNTLELDYDNDLGIVIADLAKIRQVLTHLLTNACKFTEQGRISILVRRTPLAPADEPSADASPRIQVSFQVSDTGIGMNTRQISRLFRDFTQGDESSTRKYGGTGLGLALSRRLCQLMGGTIEVESQPGQGSTFTMRLPLTVASPPFDPPLNDSAPTRTFTLSHSPVVD